MNHPYEVGCLHQRVRNGIVWRTSEAIYHVWDEIDRLVIMETQPTVRAEHV